MNKFLAKIIFFFILLAFLDFSAGTLLGFCRDHAKGGVTYATKYSFDSLTSDIIVMGSSRAYHHIIPKILSDSLGMSCYNCGYDASSIIPQYCRLVNQRHKPRIVIYEYYAGNDLYINDNIDRFQDLKLYYDHERVANIFNQVNSNDKIKMLSFLYRYNSRVNQILSDFMKGKEIFKDGFRPFVKTLKYEPKPYEPLYKSNRVDSLKWLYVEKLVKMSQEENFKLFFSISPWYKCSDDGDYTLLEAYCRNKNIPVLSHLKDTVIANHREYFADPAHLNHAGAKVYTLMLINDIRKELIRVKK